MIPGAGNVGAMPDDIWAKMTWSKGLFVLWVVMRNVLFEQIV